MFLLVSSGVGKIGLKSSVIMGHEKLVRKPLLRYFSLLKYNLGFYK